MNRIKRLPPAVTNKIAAGEVIERPASVVKELIENAIDAGSAQIDIYLAEGGKKRIQVIDYGCGMTKDDAVMSLERFSTSKIGSFEDMDNLVTFGFRGEALASIAAVSIMEMKTKTEHEKAGVVVKSEGGTVKDVRELPWNTGTSIVVNNLYFNTPARRKFQKNALSETRQIYRVFRYFALAYPDLCFSLHNDDRCIWNLKQADLKQRINDLFDPSVGKNLLEINREDDACSVKGFIGVPEWTRSTRNDQYLFLNKRHIKNKAVEHGVYHGYGTTLSHGAGHPFYILMMQLSPHLFDINIHPAKLEARFQDERGIHRFISHAVREALGVPEILNARTPVSILQKPANQEKEIKVDKSSFGNDSHVDSPVLIDFPHKERDKKEPVLNDTQQRMAENAHPAFEHEKIWQVHNCYIFSQVKSGLIIIDQHVAHERILYEKAQRRLKGAEKSSQQLLFPQLLKLDREEFVLANELLSEINDLGFDIKLHDEDTIIINAVPLEIKRGRELSVLKNMLEEYRKDEYKDHSVHDKLAASFACRSAIMKGDKLSADEMFRLIDDLFATEFPYYCPHGRPTIIDLSLNELNAKFYR
ncbi:DNA mismatch repair endonuclease MutL [candidate division KSB1 bacterium]